MPSHWGHRDLQIISGSSPIATQVPHAAGIAWAIRYRNEDAVVGCWFGDGATSEGDWHEGLNFAGIHKLPVIFVCENNQYAISVPQSMQMAIEDVADRAPGYGFPGVVVDGNDVLACYGAMKQAHERARSGEGPDIDRVQDVSVPRPYLRRRRQDVPASRRGGGGAHQRPAARVRRVPEHQRHARRCGCRGAPSPDQGRDRSSTRRSVGGVRPDGRVRVAARVRRGRRIESDRDLRGSRGKPCREERRHGDPRRPARRDGRRRPGDPARGRRREPRRGLPHQRGMA